MEQDSKKTKFKKFSFKDLADDDFLIKTKSDTTTDISADENLNITLEELKGVENQKNIKNENKYEVDYSDILKNEKYEVINNLYNNEENKEENKTEIQNSQVNVSKQKQTLKTYNEATKDISITNLPFEKRFKEESLQQFIKTKEKLEVKTNIYLKPTLVFKLKELEERTNESRSSIINKLIEIALKTIE